jgi:hypothetical protein
MISFENSHFYYITCFLNFYYENCTNQNAPHFEDFFILNPINLLILLLNDLYYHRGFTNQ